MITRSRPRLYVFFICIFFFTINSTHIEAGFSSFVITEQVSRNVKCFQSYNDIGIVERSICWHDKEFYADRWHDWPCEIACDNDIPVRIYLEDYTQQAYQDQQQQSRFNRELPNGQQKRPSSSWWGNQLNGSRGGKADWRSIFKVYIQRKDSDWQLVTYLHKGAGNCKNEHDEEGWTVWACAEIKTI